MPGPTALADSAPMPATRPPPSPTSSTGRTSPKVRRASPSPSICRRRRATTPTTSWPKARSARSACRSPTWATCARCSTAFPSTQMNTSMTINATAAWLLSLYVAYADEQGASRDKLTGTIQNDIIKEYLSRGTYVFPPEPSLRLIKDTIVFSYTRCPSGTRPTSAPTICRRRARRPCRSWPSRWRRRKPCSIRSGPRARWRRRFGAVVGRISFFVNAGLRFVTEICKMRAFNELWDEITPERYGVTDPKHRLFRYGVQVNSLGLTEPQPENNVYRILLEMLAVTLSKRRARSRRAASSLERGARPAAAVGSAVVASDAADPRLRDRSAGVSRHLRRLHRDRRKVDELKEEAKAELARIEAMGGAVAAIDYMKRRWSRATPSALPGSRPATRPSSASTAGPRPTLAADGRRRRHHGRRPGRRGRAGRAPQGLARGARRQGRQEGAMADLERPPRKAATSWSRRSAAPAPA